jgi:hypothetical protein
MSTRNKVHPKLRYRNLVVRKRPVICLICGTKIPRGSSFIVIETKTIEVLAFFGKQKHSVTYILNKVCPDCFKEIYPILESIESRDWSVLE